MSYLNLCNYDDLLLNSCWTHKGILNLDCIFLQDMFSLPFPSFLGEDLNACVTSFLREDLIVCVTSFLGEELLACMTSFLGEDLITCVTSLVIFMMGWHCLGELLVSDTFHPKYNIKAVFEGIFYKELSHFTN